MGPFESASWWNRTDALPVHYVFPRQKLDVKQAMGSLLAACKKELDDDGKKGIVVVWDVSYDWLASEFLIIFVHLYEVV